MIELVFAIVIIGIAISAIPTMISISNKNQESALVSEGIFALSAMVMQDSTYYWDDNSTNSGNLANVLDVQNCVTSADCDNNSIRVGSTIYRVGHTDEIATTTHRHFHTTNPTYATETALNESIESRETTAQTNIIAKSGSLGYKQDYTYEMSVTYVKDNTFSTSAASTDTNVKMMEYKLYKNGESNAFAIIRNFVCNIGEADYAKRSF